MVYYLWDYRFKGLSGRIRMFGEDGSWIDARTLHNELGVGKDFTNWIKGRISKYVFIENEDFKLDSPKRANQR